MCQIQPHVLPEYLTEDAIYDAVNTLPVDYLRFAFDTHYGARMFGVLNGTRFGGSDGDADTFSVNTCLRNSLWRTLLEVTQETETMLGYNLSPRYHRDTTPLPYTMRIQLDWTGVSALGVVNEISPDPVSEAVNIYVATDLTPVTVGPITYVDVSDSVMFNPADIIVRRASDETVVPLLMGQGYPRKVTGAWRVALNTRAEPLDVADLVHVQHRQYVYVDIETEDDLIPFYPNTTQKIPLARPVQTMGGTTKRYWFYSFTLVVPEFYDDPAIDLVGGEFYKLHAAVEFRTEAEAVFDALITQTCLIPGEVDPPESWKAELIPIDSQRGIVQVKVLGKWETHPVTEVVTLNTNDTDIPFSRRGYATTISYAYKTHPTSLPSHIQRDIATVLTAILHRVAADLPLNDCGCKLERGFIAEQQKSYATQLVTPTGIQMMKTEYGDLHGHKVYAEKMSKVSALKARIL